MKNNQLETKNQKEEMELLKELFDKQLEIEKMKQEKTPAWKIIAFIFVGLAAILFLAFSCYMMYMQSFTMETLLAVLLSFFSIALSIMFYIQSEKSSSSYYIRSYEIMKEVSVTLGKIEASFGEKLANISSNLEKFDRNKKEVQEKIEQGEKEQEEIKEKIAKEKLTEQQRTDLLNELQSKTEENFRLRRQLERMESMHRRDMQRHSEIRERMLSQENLINELMNNRKSRNYFMHEHNINDSDIGE